MASRDLPDSEQLPRMLDHQALLPSASRVLHVTRLVDDKREGHGYRDVLDFASPDQKRLLRTSAHHATPPAAGLDVPPEKGRE